MVRRFQVASGKPHPIRKSSLSNAKGRSERPFLWTLAANSTDSFAQVKDIAQRRIEYCGAPQRNRIADQDRGMRKVSVTTGPKYQRIAALLTASSRAICGNLAPDSFGCQGDLMNLAISASATWWKTLREIDHKLQ
jgi:hypothetical protein